ncbi:MAG: hypothetical protein ABIS27_05020, partial [Longimicrobiales bacterium]
VVIVGLVAVAVYALSLFNMFAYDDVAVISLDKRVHSLSILRSIFSISYWNNEAQGLYRPLVTGSFAVDWAVAQNHPGWFHFVNVVWNAAACILAFLLLAELFPIAPALGGALIFAVHPVHVEAVANIVGRAELMAAAFMFLAALIWLRSRNRAFIVLAVSTLYMLATMSKESAIMLPPLFVLLDLAATRLRLDSAGVKAWLGDRIGPLLAMVAVAALFLIMRAAVIPSLGPSNIDAALEMASSGPPRFYTALQVWPQYLRLLVFPLTLLADYGPRVLMPITELSMPVMAAVAILAGALIGGGAAALRGHGRTALALLWVPIAMLPVSNLLFPIGTILAERTLYLPSFAIAIAVAAAVAFVDGEAIASRHRRTTLGFLTLVCVAFTARTIVRIPDWKSTQSIFRAQARTRPDSFRAQWHFARKAVEARKPRTALELYAKTLRLWPYRSKLLKESSTYAIKMGDLPFARQINEQGVHTWPRDVDFRRSLAGVLIDLGDSAQAAIHVRQGLMIAPNDKVLNSMNAALGHWVAKP